MTAVKAKHLGRILQATLREVGQDAAAQLAWAVGFARRQPDKVTGLEALQRQATVFAAPFHARRPSKLGGLSWGPTGLGWVRARDVKVMQERFSALLEGWVQRGRIELSLRDARISVRLPAQKDSGRQGRRRPILWLEPTDTDDDVSVAVYRLVQLLGLEGHRLRGCAAPRAGGAAGEQCGAWFVGRPDQVHCSTRCRIRAGVREKRVRDALRG
jgi:hypothetical protein